MDKIFEDKSSESAKTSSSKILHYMVVADNMYNITVVDSVGEVMVFTELHTNN